MTIERKLVSGQVEAQTLAPHAHWNGIFGDDMISLLEGCEPLRLKQYYVDLDAEFDPLSASN